MFFPTEGINQTKHLILKLHQGSSVTKVHNCYSRYLGIKMHGSVSSELWISFGKRLLLLMSNIHTL